MDGLTDKPGLDQNILKPLLDWASKPLTDEHIRNEKLEDYLVQQVLLISETEWIVDVHQALRKVLFGSTMLLVEGMPGALLLGSSRPDPFRRGTHLRSRSSRTKNRLHRNVKRQYGHVAQTRRK